MDDKTIWSDLGHSGIEKDVFDMGDVRDVNVICPKPNNFYNYNRFKNKPQINGVTLEGNKTTEELGIHEYDDTEIREMISDIEDEQEVQDTNIANNAEGIEEINRGLVNYSLVNETGYRIDLEMDSQTFDLVAKLYDKNGNLLSTSSDIDLPLESLVVSVEYDSVNKEIVITLESGEVTRVPVGDLVEGLVSVEDLEEALEGYYTKTETDDLLSPINSDISDLQDDIDGLQSDIDSINAEQTTQDENIAQNAADISTLNDDLANYSLITETGSQVALTLDNTNYKMKVILKDKNGNTIYTSNEIDLPMESVVINGFYDNTTKEVVLTLVNGSTIRFSVASLVSGLVSDEDLTAILGNYYTSAEIDTLLVDYVKNTDYATASKGGVIKGSSYYGNAIDSDGHLQGVSKTYAEYSNGSNGLFISKGTLENVIAGKELVNQETLDESQAEQDTNIEDNRKDIDFIEGLIDQFETVDGNGTDLELDDTAEYKMAKLDMLGNSSQFSTTGKNLLNVESDLEFTRSKTVSVNIPAGIYYITNNGTTTSDDTTRVTIRFNNNNKTYNVSVNDSVGVTLTTDETTIYLYSKVDYPTSAGVSATIKNLMISVDGGTYEPYTNGASPNPDYPQNVKSVTGENNVIIRTDNLFDKNNLIYNKRLDSNGELTINDNNVCTTDYFIKVEPNTTYYSSQKLSGTRCVCCYDNNKNHLQRLMYLNTYTFTTLANTSYIKMSLYTNGAENEPGVEYEQLVKGSTAPTSYVEHQEQNYQLSLGDMELCSSLDGTIRDGIIGKPNEWYKREYWHKFSLNGSETVQTINSYNKEIFRIRNIYSSATSLEICTHYKFYKQANYSDYAILPSYGDSLQIRDDRFLENGVLNVASYKTWLQTQYNNDVPVTIWYALGTPQDILITDTTLIEQLNDIYNNAHSYSGVTNITTTYEDGNEQMYLDASAIRQLSGYVTEDELSDYVKNTDYASSSKGGVIKTNTGAGTSIDSNGILRGVSRSYNAYSGDGLTTFISKGTLENVIEGKELINQSTLDQSQATQDANIEENASNIEELQNIVDQLPHEEDKGADVKLEPTIDAKMSIDMLGNSSQFSTTGKNKIDFDTLFGSASFLTKNSDGSYTATGDGTAKGATVDVNIPAGDYYLSVDYVAENNVTVSGDGNLLAMNIFYEDDTSSWSTLILNTSTVGTRLSFKVSEINKAIKRIYLGQLPRFTGGTVTFKNVQIGTDAIYEPYTNGASPNPSYPQNVKSVTGENSIVLQNENLLPNNGLNSYTVYDIQYTKNTDSSITAVGTASGSSADYYLFGSNQDAGNYLHIPKGDYSLKSLPNEFVYIFREKTLGALTNPTVIKNALLSQDCYFYGIAVRVTRNMSVNTTIYPMLVKGSTAPSTYVEHEEQNYQLTLKSWNLLNWQNCTQGKAWNDSGQLVNNAVCWACNEKQYTNKSSLTFSVDFTPSTGTQGRVYQFNSSDTLIVNTAITTFPTTINLNANCAYYVYYFVDSMVAFNSKLQIVEGNQAKEYHPYTENPIELCKIGDYQDYIYKNGDNWFKKELVGKLVLSSELPWTKSSTTEVDRFGFNTTLYKNYSGSLCSHFIKSGVVTTIGRWFNNSSVQLGFNYSAYGTTTLEQWLNWIDNNNITLYQPLVTPQDVLITDTTLINQLNYLYDNAHSYKGTTNVTSTYEDGNEQMIIEVSAIRQADDYVTESELTDYVKKTNYATSTTSGVIKVAPNTYGTNMDSSGYLQAQLYTYQLYDSGVAQMFISKGTLENVIAGKDLTTKAYVDGLVGDISDALDAINGENLEGGA